MPSGFSKNDETKQNLVKCTTALHSN